MERRLVMVNRSSISTSLEDDLVMYVDNELPYCLESNVKDWVFTNFGMDFDEFGSYNDGQTSYLVGIVSSRHKKWPDSNVKEIQWLKLKKLNHPMKQEIIKILEDHLY